MLDDTSLTFATFSEPSELIKPKCLRKYGALTTPPLAAVFNQQISDIKRSLHTRYHYVIVWEGGQRLKLGKRTCRIQRVCSPKTPQMPALSKMIDNVPSQKDRPTVDPIVLEYTLHFTFHPGTARQAVWWLRAQLRGVDRFADGSSPMSTFIVWVVRSVVWATLSQMEVSRFGAQEAKHHWWTNWADSEPNNVSPSTPCIIVYEKGRGRFWVVTWAMMNLA